MTQFQVTPMKKNHVPFLYELLNTPEIMDALHMKKTTVDTWQEAYETWARDTDEENYIIEEGTAPVGWLSLNGLDSGTTAWIKMLVVHPSFQHIGAGTFAISEAERILRERVFDKLCIQTRAGLVDKLEFIDEYTSLSYGIRHLPVPYTRTPNRIFHRKQYGR